MPSLKGIITKQIGGDTVKLRFSNYTQLLFLKLLRSEGLSEENLNHFEVRAYLFFAALQAAEMPFESIDEVCDLMDELSEDEQITILEEAGEYLDFLGKLAQALRVQYEHDQEQMRILTAGRQMMTEILTQEATQTLTMETMNSMTNPTGETLTNPMELSPNL